MRLPDSMVEPFIVWLGHVAKYRHVESKKNAVIANGFKHVVIYCKPSVKQRSYALNAHGIEMLGIFYECWFQIGAKFIESLKCKSNVQRQKVEKI